MQEFLYFIILPEICDNKFFKLYIIYITYRRNSLIYYIIKYNNKLKKFPTYVVQIADNRNKKNFSNNTIFPSQFKFLAYLYKYPDYLAEKDGERIDVSEGKQ